MVRIQIRTRLIAWAVKFRLRVPKKIQKAILNKLRNNKENNNLDYFMSYKFKNALKWNQGSPNLGTTLKICCPVVFLFMRNRPGPNHHGQANPNHVYCLLDISQNRSKIVAKITTKKIIKILKILKKSRTLSEFKSHKNLKVLCHQEVNESYI